MQFEDLTGTIPGTGTSQPALLRAPYCMYIHKTEIPAVRTYHVPPVLRSLRSILSTKYTTRTQVLRSRYEVVM